MISRTYWCQLKKRKIMLYLYSSHSFRIQFLNFQVSDKIFRGNPLGITSKNELMRYVHGEMSVDINIANSRFTQLAEDNHSEIDKWALANKKVYRFCGSSESSRVAFVWQFFYVGLKRITAATAFSGFAVFLLGYIDILYLYEKVLSLRYS